MIKSGYWPSTPKKVATFYAVELMELWDSISLNSPGTSLSSFLTSIVSISSCAGRVCRFKYILKSEWQGMTFIYRQYKSVYI